MIEILVLQNPKVLVNKQEMMFPYKKVEALLYYMAVEKSATRDQIATLLWEDCDESSARKNLRHALYTIRKVFGEELITSPTRQNLELNQELEIESDYDRFLEENEKNGTEVYKSDFLQNFYLKNAGAFEDWMNFKRGKLKEIYLNRLYEKMQNVEHLSLKKREKLFERYTTAEPIDERIYMMMMQIYAKEGLYYKGIRIYQQLSEKLHTELGILPGKEIQEFYNELMENWVSESEHKEDETQGDGRERERCLLRGIYRKFLAGEDETVFLAGESGIGKTYLAESFLKEIQEESVLIMRTSCLATEKNMTLQAWNTLMMELNTYLKEKNMTLPTEYLRAADQLFPLFSRKEEIVLFEDVEISYSYRTARNLILKLFEELGRQIKVVLFLDNIQNMDASSLDFLSLLIRSRNKNLFILGTCPVNWEDRLKKSLSVLVKEKQITKIFVSPFSRKNVEQTLVERLGRKNVTEKFLNSIYEETNGNPFLIHTLLDYYKGMDLKEDEVVPMTQVWKMRLDSLPYKTRKVLELIASCQAWSDMEALVAILRQDELEILEAIERLKEEHFIYEKQEKESVRFYFIHESTQRYVHIQMSPSRRRVFHSKLAEYIAKSPIYDASRFERLIYHYCLAGNKEKTLEYKILALQNYAYKSYEHYPVAPLMSGIKQEKEESVLEYCDRLEEELKDIYEESGQQEKYIRFHAILMETQAQYCIPQGYYRRGIECIEKALKSIGCIGEDAKEKIHCLRFLIYYRLNIWETENLEELLEESLKLAQKQGYQEEYAITCRLYGIYYGMIGKFEEAEEKLEEALEYFKRVPLKERIYASNISGCYNYIGEIQRKQKHFKEAEAYYKQAIAVCRKNHIPCTPAVYCNLARVYQELGEVEKGELVFYKADLLYEESYMLIGRSIAKGALALLEAKKGEFEKASLYLMQAKKSANQLGSPYAKGLFALHEWELKKKYSEKFKKLLTKEAEDYRKEAEYYLKPLKSVYELEKI